MKEQIEKKPQSGYKRLEPKIKPPYSFQVGEILQVETHDYPGFTFNHFSHQSGPEVYQSNKHPNLLVVSDAHTPLSITSERSRSVMVVNPGLLVDDVTVEHDDSYVLILESKKKVFENKETGKKDEIEVSTGNAIVVSKDKPYKFGDEVESIPFAEALLALPQYISDEVQQSSLIYHLNLPSRPPEWELHPELYGSGARKQKEVPLWLQKETIYEYSFPDDLTHKSVSIGVRKEGPQPRIQKKNDGIVVKSQLLDGWVVANGASVQARSTHTANSYNKGAIDVKGFLRTGEALSGSTLTVQRAHEVFAKDATVIIDVDSWRKSSIDTLSLAGGSNIVISPYADFKTVIKTLTIAGEGNTINGEPITAGWVAGERTEAERSLRKHKRNALIGAGASVLTTLGLVGGLAVAQDSGAEQKTNQPVVTDVNPKPTTIFDRGNLLNPFPSKSPSATSSPTPSLEVKPEPSKPEQQPEVTPIVSISHPLTPAEKAHVPWNRAKVAIERALKQKQAKNNDIAITSMLMAVGEPNQMLDDRTIQILLQDPALAEKRAVILANNPPGSKAEVVAQEKKGLLFDIAHDVTAIRTQEAAPKKMTIDRTSKAFKEGQAAIKALGKDLARRTPAFA